MAIPKRRSRVPGTYFVTSRTWESRPLFRKELFCQIFVDTLLHYRDDKLYQLHAFVLMSDHFHVLLTPGTNSTLERVVQHIKGVSARWIGREMNLHFPVWQRGFSDHRIRDREDWEAHIDYIEQNPVKQKLVAVASDYAWSSASRRFLMDEAPQGLKPMMMLAAFGTTKVVP